MDALLTQVVHGFAMDAQAHDADLFENRRFGQLRVGHPRLLTRRSIRRHLLQGPSICCRFILISSSLLASETCESQLFPKSLEKGSRNACTELTKQVFVRRAGSSAICSDPARREPNLVRVKQAPEH
jgi:hypothetical protein